MTLLSPYVLLIYRRMTVLDLRAKLIWEPDVQGNTQAINEEIQIENLNAPCSSAYTFYIHSSCTSYNTLLPAILSGCFAVHPLHDGWTVCGLSTAVNWLHSDNRRWHINAVCNTNTGTAVIFTSRTINSTIQSAASDVVTWRRDAQWCRH